MDDTEAIRQLTARYGRAGDSGDLAGWLECFTTDGSFERPDKDRIWKGHSDLADMFGGYGVTGRHLTTDSIIEVNGDSATQTCYLLFLDASRSFQPHMVGVYHDDLIRQNGHWRFARRRLLVDFVAGE
jgi:SnoaL-like domain